MKGANFEGATFDLVKPNDMTDEQCSSLPAANGIDENGYPFIVVAFKPSPEDILTMYDGGLLYMKVLGGSFAPVALFTLDKDGNANPM